MKSLNNLNISKFFVNDCIRLLQGNKKLIKNIIEVSIDVYNHGKNSQYYRHSLKGELRGILDFQVTGDIRMFVLYEKEKIKFLRIGTHSHLGI